MTGKIDKKNVDCVNFCQLWPVPTRFAFACAPFDHHGAATSAGTRPGFILHFRYDTVASPAEVGRPPDHLVEPEGKKYE